MFGLFNSGGKVPHKTMQAYNSGGQVQGPLSPKAKAEAQKLQHTEIAFSEDQRRKEEAHKLSMAMKMKGPLAKGE